MRHIEETKDGDVQSYAASFP